MHIVFFVMDTYEEKYVQYFEISIIFLLQGKNVEKITGSQTVEKVEELEGNGANNR